MRELTTNELKQVQINIMKYVDSFCKKNNLKYFICSGTLIGAARHKGFIPWDDDIDIMMPREDYNRFIELFSAEEGQYKIWSHRLQKNYPYSYVKVTDENTVKKENILKAIEIGVDIDVFPLDDIPDDEHLAEKFIKECKIFYTLMNIKKTRLSKERPLIKNIVLFLGRIGLSFYPLKKMIIDIETHAEKYHNCKGRRYINAVFCMAGQKELHDKELFSEVIEMPFENEFFKGPKGYDAILKTRYGDYMKLPPIEKQVTHHGFHAFWKNKV